MVGRSYSAANPFAVCSATIEGSWCKSLVSANSCTDLLRAPRNKSNFVSPYCREKKLKFGSLYTPKQVHSSFVPSFLRLYAISLVLQANPYHALSTCSQLPRDCNMEQWCWWYSMFRTIRSVCRLQRKAPPPLHPSLPAAVDSLGDESPVLKVLKRKKRWRLNTGLEGKRFLGPTLYWHWQYRISELLKYWSNLTVCLFLEKNVRALRVLEKP